MNTSTTPEVARLEALRARIMSRANAAERASEHDIATVLRGIARSVDAALAEARAAPSPDGEIEALLRECGHLAHARLGEGRILIRCLGDDVAAWVPLPDRIARPYELGREGCGTSVPAALRALRDKLAPPELPDYDAMGWEELDHLLPAGAVIATKHPRVNGSGPTYAVDYGPNSGPRSDTRLGAVRAYCREHKLGAKGGAS